MKDRYVLPVKINPRTGQPCQGRDKHSVKINPRTGQDPVNDVGPLAFRLPGGLMLFFIGAA